MKILAVLTTLLFLTGCGSGIDEDRGEPVLLCSTGEKTMSAHQMLMATYTNPMIVVDSADFDGTNDYMTRALFSGAADSKTGILSVWLRIDAGDGSSRMILGNDTIVNSRFSLILGTTNLVQILGIGTDVATKLSIRTAGAYTAGAAWLHVLASWNLATAGARAIYVNDTLDFSEITFTDADIDYTPTSNLESVGADAIGNNKFSGCIAELYFAPGQYLDFSLVHNRRKFISASGKPVHLGTTGALPTGTAPIAYLHLDNAEAVANFATNRGTGGNFSITGTLDTGSSSPSD